MKRLLPLAMLLATSFFLTACEPPSPDKDIPKADLFGSVKVDNSRFFDDQTQEKVDSQIGVPETGEGFDQGLTEKAKNAGLTDKDLNDVRAKLAESFSMELAEVQITIEGESTTEYMTGYVNVGESSKGGIYFAAKTKTGWELAHNGMGVIYCDSVEKYNFPVGMIPRCYDLDTGKTIDRE